jgi:hypothetical protein
MKIQNTSTQKSKKYTERSTKYLEKRSTSKLRNEVLVHWKMDYLYNEMDHKVHYKTESKY